MEMQALRRHFLVALSVLALAGGMVAAGASNAVGPRAAVASSTVPVPWPQDACESHEIYAQDDERITMEPLVLCWDRAGYLSVAAPGW